MNICSSKEFGEAIRARRKALGYTQQQVADAAGVGLMLVSQLERGKETCQLQKALDIANAVGLDVLIASRGERF